MKQIRLLDAIKISSSKVSNSVTFMCYVYTELEGSYIESNYRMGRSTNIRHNIWYTKYHLHFSCFFVNSIREAKVLYFYRMNLDKLTNFRQFLNGYKPRIAWMPNIFWRAGRLAAGGTRGGREWERGRVRERENVESNFLLARGGLVNLLESSQTFNFH